jgi:hypothetical protein
VLDPPKTIHHNSEEYETENKERNKRESAEEETEQAGVTITVQTRIQ